MSNLQNDTIIETLYSEISDLLPALTTDQAEKLDELIKENDLEGARFYLSFLAKLHIPEEVYAEAEYERAERVVDERREDGLPV